MTLNKNAQPTYPQQWHQFHDTRPNAHTSKEVDHLTLAELKKITPNSGHSEIENKLAQLFSVTEMSESNTVISEDLFTEQISLSETIDSFYDQFYKQTRREFGQDFEFNDLDSVQKVRLSEIANTFVLDVKMRISMMPLVLVTAKQDILNFFAYLSEKTELDANLVATVNEQLEHKKMTAFLIAHPDKLKKSLYEMYQSLDLPHSEKRKFLKNAIILMEELIESQTDAFLKGYEEVWQLFESAGMNEINLTEDDIRRIFFAAGYEMSSKGNIDFTTTLFRALTNHNTITSLFNRRPELVGKSANEQGKLFFKAFIGPSALFNTKYPYGEVKIDLSPPVTSIRLICEDVRDYTLLTDQISLQEYENNLVQQSASQGGTYRLSVPFKLSFKEMWMNLPLSAALGKRDIHSLKSTRLHEDAHQAALNSETAGRVNVSAELRSTSKLSQRAEFSSFIARDDSEHNMINFWRNSLKEQLDESMYSMRDEVQAFLSSGEGIESIATYLRSNEPAAGYDFVGDTKFRTKYVTRIQNASWLSNQQEVLNLFKEDVKHARELYDVHREKYLKTVKTLIDIFTNKSNYQTSKTRVALLVRHTLPEELIETAKYLARRTTPTEKVTKVSELDFRPGFNIEYATNDILRLSDSDLQVLLTQHQHEMTQLLLTVWEILQKRPSYIALSQLEQKFESPITIEYTRLLFSSFKILREQLKTELPWSKQDLSEYNECIQTIAAKEQTLLWPSQGHESIPSILANAIDALRYAERLKQQTSKF